jgi:hypothetical protein
VGFARCPLVLRHSGRGGDHDGGPDADRPIQPDQHASLTAALHRLRKHAFRELEAAQQHAPRAAGSDEVDGGLDRREVLAQPVRPLGTLTPIEGA